MSKLKSLIPLQEIEQSALDQIDEVLKLPMLKKLAIMPDVHAGYDLCIGGVALLDGHISPSFVGYDIGCGMSFIETEILLGDFYNLRKETFNAIYSLIPVGFNLHESEGNEYPTFKSALGDKKLDDKVNAKLHKSLGTLGGGNHFIEIGYNRKNKICVTIHSGSRNIGHSIATAYMKIGGILDIKTTEGFRYFEDMNFALEYALRNRLIMMRNITCILGISWESVAHTFINENHNHAIYTDDGILHRKGATSADEGQIGIIPANMRDGVYITKGLGNKEYLSSASHGAGRRYSRTKAKKEIHIDDFTHSMRGIVAKVDCTTLDESPFAYKNIDTVIKYQEGIVLNVIDKITPLVNVKG